MSFGSPGRNGPPKDIFYKSAKIGDESSTLTFAFCPD